MSDCRLYVVAFVSNDRDLSEINLDRGMVVIDYGDLLKGCKFEEFHERGTPLICDYPVYNWRTVKV